MADVQHLGWFIVAGWLLNLTPGPDVLCVTQQAARQGWRAGAWTALGVSAGCLVHVLAAALGLGALLQASATAFTLLKWAGAAYLVYIGLRMICTPAHSNQSSKGELPAASAVLGWGASVRLGFCTNALNPKVALFFLAFVPQFIAQPAQHPSLSFLVLGALFTLNSLPILLGYAWLGAQLSRLAQRFQRMRRHVHWFERGVGLLFVGFGARLAVSD